jgi:hypothetical protein
MVIQELIERSPVRIFEQSIKGGLMAGELGIVAAPSGIGKTSVLVQLALDKLLRNERVIHVSFTNTNYVLAWYEEIFNELIDKKSLENIHDIKNELLRNRVLMNFSQGAITIEQILRSLRALIIDGGFPAQALIIDGSDFTMVNRDGIACVKQFAGELGLEVWYSCTVTDAGYDEQHIPVLVHPYRDAIDVVIVLEQKPDHIVLSVAKNQDGYQPDTPTLRLDPKTLLIQ